MRDDYAKELDALVTSLTKAGKLEEAVSVRRFRQSLPASPANAPQVAGPLKPLPSGEVPTTTDTGTSPIVTERSVGPTAKPTPVLNNPDNATVRWSYLSDIEEQAATVGFDQFVKGKLTLKDKKITVGGDIPRHGLYAHAPSNITYDLSHQAFVAFKGRVGLIDGSWGEVEFIVVGDGKELWKSPVVKKEREGKNPKMVQFDLNIRGVRELVMKVDPLGSQVSDHSVWVDPQLGK
jgi:hypothetical protein